MDDAAVNKAQQKRITINAINKHTIAEKESFVELKIIIIIIIICWQLLIPYNIASKNEQSILKY